MTVPALNRCQVQLPQQEHGATAAAQVPLLDQNQAAASTVVAHYGFTKAGKDKYEAKDGSWVQWNADRAIWERGVGTVQFRGVPQKLSALAAQRYSVGAYGQHAIAFLPKLSASDAAANRAALAKAGFSAVLPCYFSHADGTWVAFVGSKMIAGVDAERITGLPKPGSAKPPAPAKGNGKTYRRYTDNTLPTDWDTWRSRFAIAKVPRAEGQFTDAQLRKILRHLGFRSAGGGDWTHPDGSKVTLQGGRIVGSQFQKWGFGNFPYQVGQHSQRWAQDTTAWLSWVKGEHKQPPYGRV